MCEASYQALGVGGESDQFVCIHTGYQTPRGTVVDLEMHSSCVLGALGRWDLCPVWRSWMCLEGGRAGFGLVDIDMAMGVGSSILSKARRWEIVDCL